MFQNTYPLAAPANIRIYFRELVILGNSNIDIAYIKLFPLNKILQ